MVIGDLQQGKVKLLNKNQQLERENKDLKQEISNIVKSFTNNMIKKGFSNVYMLSKEDNQLRYVDKDQYLKSIAPVQEKKKVLHIPTVDEIRGINRNKDQGFKM